MREYVYVSECELFAMKFVVESECAGIRCVFDSYSKT